MGEACILDIKICNDCGVEYPKAAFPKHGKYARAYCKTCTGIRSRTQGLLRNYGITQVEYDTLYNKQHGSCAVCGIHQSSLKKRLAVDHNHTTGKVRGLLCDNCNRGIGLLQDNPTLLQQATTYLLETN